MNVRQTNYYFLGMGDRFGTDMSSEIHELCQLTDVVCPNLGQYAEIAVRFDKIYNYRLPSLFLITDYLCINNTYAKTLASHVIPCRLRSQPLMKQEVERRKQEMGCREIAYCASARSGYSGAYITSCVTSYFLLHASDFVWRFHDRSHGMTWKGRPTLHPLPPLCTIRARKITTVVTVHQNTCVD